ncbi:sensor histidine kinase KdpD [Chitiniphilus purpureus]|uniref:histidine kinase n=1 Tax=Chitiniphilus purpureus TaxID=2981137 RepID=A0ABY6DL05_9NEIS|nr:sensor histidine kinase KdpD [Chitiniphilus sp. CD1]UXY14913.1 sensor histidine kinase KdpD [Chitiniphilus sp. CD1]
MTDQRPDPDRLLAELHRKAQATARGRLKIFFGACAGVGKTYAMLKAAQARRCEGVTVLLGVVETHGRQETAALLDGLPLLPPAQVAYRGRTLAGFDLDGALARVPQLVVVDEYAHANVPGSRHAKRWQDVEELLDAGIDVYTALNVQHLESLNDVVNQITGIAVRETIPDRVFDAAFDVMLVDLSPDELLVRLAEGKVYLGAQAEHAAQHFFRKGNLLALRELALRRVADRVDGQMRAYRADQAIGRIWQARERLMVCVGPGPAAARLLRSAARLAASLHADWLAVYVETPRLQRLDAMRRAQVLKSLALAQELGAETCVLAGNAVAPVLLAYAGSRNASKLVVGASRVPRWRRAWRAGLAEQLSQARDVDVYMVAHELPAEPAAGASAQMGFYAEPISGARDGRGHLAAVGACMAATVLAALLHQVFDLANVVMLYLLAVVAVAVRHGRGPGALASLLAVAGFDFFFVPPRLSFTVSDTQYLLTFGVMLAVALTIGQLAARLRFEATVATQRERRTRALFDLARELAGALTADEIVRIATAHLAAVFGGRAALLLPDGQDRVRAAGGAMPTDATVAQWVYEHAEPAGQGTRTLPLADALYLPLKAPMRVRGVAALAAAPRSLALPEQRRLLDTCASQIGLALERVHYVAVAQDALVAIERERLRNSVLTIVSHDLRTPLTSLTGLASLLAEHELPPAQQRELAQTLRDETLRLSRLVDKILEMARLEAGVRLAPAWQPIDEVIGSARVATAGQLHPRRVLTDLPAGLPILQFDGVLIERVLVNLLENAAKYTPTDATVRITVRCSGAALAVTVADDGPGLPPGLAVFDKFTRAAPESAIPGAGLGLAICKAILAAHGGTIEAHPVAPHGVAFVFTLPVQTPPGLPE